MALLTVIVPCYNEEENVKFFYEELMKNNEIYRDIYNSQNRIKEAE